MLPMNVLAVYSQSHKKLFDDFFVKTLPDGLQVVESRLSSLGNGSYLSQDWRNGVVAKLTYVLDYSEQMRGKIFCLSDVDIQFFPSFRIANLLEEFEQSGVDVLFQRESSLKNHREANTGFYIARSTPYFCDLLRKSITNCRETQLPNDQTAINTVLDQEAFGTQWGLLSLRYYARSQGFPPMRDVVLHHANQTKTIDDKISQLKRVRKIVTGGFFERSAAFCEETSDYALSGRLTGMLWRKVSRLFSQAN
jgi:hypothetical protein